MAADYGYQTKKGNYLPKSTERSSVALPRTARARITGANASYKDLSEVCRNVRGWDTEMALEFLEQASIGEKAIRFRRHCAGKGHRRELGGKKGGWPMKSVKIVLGVLKNAMANANKLGLGSAKIAHIVANKQDTFPRMSPKGRRIVHNYETAFVEIVLEEVQQKADTVKKDKNKGKAKEAAKPEPSEKKPEAAKQPAATATDAPTEKKTEAAAPAKATDAPAEKKVDSPKSAPATAAPVAKPAAAQAQATNQ